MPDANFATNGDGVGLIEKSPFANAVIAIGKSSGELNNMTKKEALEYLADGHSIFSVEDAKKVCKAVEVEFSNDLILRWKGQADANPNNHPKGIWLREDKPGEGVGADNLSNYVTHKLGLKVWSYHGRGTQSRANAEAIAKHFGIK